MATPKTTANPQLVVPAAANSVAITPSGTAWNNSSWVQLTTGLGTIISILGVIVDSEVLAQFEIDIGKGAAGSEVVVGTVIGNFLGTSNGDGDAVFPFVIPIENIASSTRIAVRLRKEGTSTTAWGAKLVYGDIGSDIGVTANPSLPVPSAANGASVTPSGTSWGNSAWVELSASLTNICLLGVAVDPGTTEIFEVDIGKGAAGSEVVVGTIGADVITNASTTSGPSFYPFRIPIEVSGSQRIAVRMRKNGTSTTAWEMKLLYVSTSGFGSKAVEFTTQPQLTTPNNNVTNIASSGTTWGNTGWTEFIASTANEIVVVSHYSANATNAESEYEADIGKGAAGSETVVTTHGDYVQTTELHASSKQYPSVKNIPASTRVAVRHRKNNTNTGAISHGILYYETPL